MPWKEVSIMSQRKEFVMLAMKEGSNIRGLCRRYGISSRTGYKWIGRYREQGETGLENQSRRPLHSPRQSSGEVEVAVLEVRQENPRWGGRKIARVLKDQGKKQVPHPNTVTDILRRNGKIEADEAQKHEAWHRFEKSSSNELWQMDFKGYFDTGSGRCYPFTVLDDHSRFVLGLKACGNETKQTVQSHLTSIFRQYGLPVAILADNGNPWKGKRPQMEYSELAIWLIRLGVKVYHGRPAHPQTQGKDERFHRTLKAELLSGRSFLNLDDCQYHFDWWRDRYNLERPHEALNLDTPIQHYQPSCRPFPEILPVIEYDASEVVRKVQAGGIIFYMGKEYRSAKSLRGQLVALRPTQEDGCVQVIFCNHIIDTIYLNHPIS